MPSSHVDGKWVTEPTQWEVARLELVSLLMHKEPSVYLSDRQLRRREFIVDTYSIADIACYPWIQPERQKQNIDDFPDLKRWRESIAARPATQRAYAIAKTINVKPAISDEESRKILFGQGRHTVR